MEIKDIKYLLKCFENEVNSENIFYTDFFGFYLLLKQTLETDTSEYFNMFILPDLLKSSRFIQILNQYGKSDIIENKYKEEK